MRRKPYVRSARGRPLATHLFVGLLTASCSSASRAPADGDAAASQAMLAREPSARDLVLAPHHGDSSAAARIRDLQRRAANSKVPLADFERLGWAFVAAAREASDPGTYKLALETARVMEAYDPVSRGAQLLRGHALHSLHHFAEAERVARHLVAVRGLPFDYGLLGDVLVDRGGLDEAIAAYQHMVDERPDAQSYARAGHVRFLKGDLDGAIAAMHLARGALSPRDRESSVWVWARLASYQLTKGELSEATHSVQRALTVAPQAPEALKVRAQLHLAQEEFGRALALLERAAAQAPHPEILWMLAESLEALGRKREAEGVHAQIEAAGEREDPRAFSLYLATRGEHLERARELLRAEFAERADVYTHEALAWTASARGDHALALHHAESSLAEGTVDARLYYHAGRVAERASDPRAQAWLSRARSLAHALLPSQRAYLAARPPSDAAEHRVQTSADARFAGRRLSTSAKQKGTP